MNKSIVFKLFLLTTALCLFILTLVFVGQSLFFKQVYIHQKVARVKTALEVYEQDYLKQAGNAQSMIKLEQDFYQKQGTWIAALDDRGNLQYTDDFQMEILLDRPGGRSGLGGTTLTVPLYTIMKVEDFSSGNRFLVPWIGEGRQIALEGLIIDNQPVVQRLGRSISNLREDNRLQNLQMVKKEYGNFPSLLEKGTITAIRIPDGVSVSRYTNHQYLDRIKAFQANLLYGNVDDGANLSSISDFEENHIQYKIFVNRINDHSGKVAYLFAMTSLQPVNEAAEMMQDYYVYIIIATLLLVLLASLYFSRRIVQPLLRMNETTQRMANLDFSESIPVTTKDEIGNLSRNINVLSARLHSHITRLEEDIEQEKQLEQTRKEFISGVSHELKTPLSVIQSCLSILKDGVASHKRDYYFTAMEDEVKRMDLLIVDMLELAKYESGTYKMEMEFFDIADVLERVSGKFTSVLASKQLQIHIYLQSVEVVANQRRIEQVIVNFLMNAICYTPVRQSIVVSMLDEEDTVQVCIENKGVYISDEQLEKIWDRFYRGEPSRQRASGGTGLGLAISKKILELHRVSYGVANTPEGVLFYFSLHKRQ
ncbi:sensor histidine kinase [Paenibacillus aquistagni]|uniref:sensor histidine kinase n=1 Tax=Paenibacillus aquistagni TaxID=1852522 RepID=UPI000B50565B|nr:HAMP domain-containing sensor histidine kinase [Paenibacillus aquistagni]